MQGKPALMRPPAAWRISNLTRQLECWRDMELTLDGERWQQTALAVHLDFSRS